MASRVRTEVAAELALLSAARVHLAHELLGQVDLLLCPIACWPAASSLFRSPCARPPNTHTLDDDKDLAQLRSFASVCIAVLPCDDMRQMLRHTIMGV